MENVKVLFVEDEAALGMVVSESLEMRGFHIIHCEDGQEGYDKFIRNKPDICVLDVMLPKKDGFTLAKEIRKHSPHIPIIFLTARSKTEDVVKGFEIGGNDYLKKPILDGRAHRSYQSFITTHNHYSHTQFRNRNHRDW